ncbi:hypothetical protein [Streptomyces shenzhenensis]|uniref:hypothetical protein n=1 Tax=Streptomyces shenzhenensis TaxID=943815 RepID=UPI00369C26F5
MRGLHKKLASCAEVLEETHGLVTRLMDGSYWTGDAAVAFREELRGGPLALNLRNAAHSLRKAAGQLVRWEGELDDFQRRAGRLDADARDAREALDRAKGRASQARSAPALDEEAGLRHDDAQQALTQANAAVAHAQADLDAVLGRARKLAAEHEEKARHRAAKIHAATRKLAPQEPGFFEKSLAWLTDNLPDILSWTAAFIGIIALSMATGGTAAAVLLLSASALSAGAMAGRLADPAVRASLWDGFRRQEFDADFWSNAIAVTADGLGMLPGLGAVAKGTPALMRGVGEAGEALTAGQRLVAAGDRTMASAREFTDLHNPITIWVTEKAPRLRPAVEATEAAAPWAGFATASYGLAASNFDALDNNAAANIGTGMDGYFLGPVNVGETIDLARRVFHP